MFSISYRDNAVFLSGRFDASQVDNAEAVFDKLEGTSFVDFKDLEYISSAGLGILLKTQKRLSSSGNSLILRNMNKLIRDVFKIARFDLVFQIEATE